MDFAAESAFEAEGFSVFEAAADFSKEKFARFYGNSLRAERL